MKKMKINERRMNKLFIFATILLFSAILYGCFSAQSVIKKTSEKYPIPDNGIHKDIPYYDSLPYPYVFYTYARQKEDALNLPKLLNGYNDFIFRVWITSPSRTLQPGELIEIRQTNNEWSGTYYNMTIKFVYSKNEEQIKEFKKYDIHPKNITWNQLMGYLVEDGIFELRSLDQLDEYKALPEDQKGYAPGSSTISFEVATSQLYRFFQYNSLPKYIQFPEVQQVQRIMNLLTSEFAVGEFLENSDSQIIIHDLREAKPEN